MILIAYLIDYPNVKMRIDIGIISPVKEFTTNNTIERLVTQNVSIAPHKVINWCKKNNPKMIVSDIDGSNEMVYDYLNGYVGEQLKLKLEE
jgi:hypothetical protein